MGNAHPTTTDFQDCLVIIPNPILYLKTIHSPALQGEVFLQFVG